MIALVVLLFVSVVVTAGLSYAGTSASTTGKAITPNRTARIDADSATQAAVQYVSRNQVNGGTVGQDLGLPCPPSAGADPDATFQYAGASGTVDVYICPRNDSFNLEGNTRAVLLTLAGPASGEGINFRQNEDILVNGNVWTSSYIALQGAAPAVQVNGGKLWSWNPSSCSGNISVPAGMDCSAGVTLGFSTLSGGMSAGTTTLNIGDPGSYPATGDQYVVAVDNERMLVTGGYGTSSWTVTRGYGGTAPAAHSGGARVSLVLKVGVDPADPFLGHASDWQPDAPPGALQTPAGCALAPGLYASGSALSARTTTAACPGGVTLAPGVYYLNFPASDPTWTIDTNVTGACDGSGEGAQLVFADEARIAMGDSFPMLDLCGRKVSSDAPRIAMTYATTSTPGGGPQSSTLRPTAAATTSGSHPQVNWTNLGAVVPTGDPGYPQDGSNTTGTTFGGNRTAVLNIGSMTPTAGSIPPNATVTSIVVRVAHDETSSWNFDNPRLVWGGCDVGLNPTESTGATVFTSPNLAGACGAFDPSQPATVLWRLEKSGGGTHTVHVDGAQIDVQWNPPGVAAQTGCVTQLLGAGGCYVLDGPANGHDRMIIDGVVHLPKNAIRGIFKNGGALEISDALIARSVDFDANPATIGAPIIGGTINDFTTGNVLFNSEIDGTGWIDAYASFEQSSAVPTIRTWIVKR